MVYVAAWLAFVAAVYLGAWIDHLYFSRDLPARFRHMRQELFEES